MSFLLVPVLFPALPCCGGGCVWGGPALAPGRDHGCSSVSASICWTRTGSSSLPFSFGASGILPAPFKLCSCPATDGNPFHVCVDCKKILVLNQLSLGRVLRWSKWQRAWGWAERGTVQQRAASCRAEAKASLVYIHKKSSMSECCLDAAGTAGVGQARGPASAVQSPKVTTADARGKHVEKKPKTTQQTGQGGNVVLSLDISLSI